MNATTPHTPRPAAGITTDLSGAAQIPRNGQTIKPLADERSGGYRRPGRPSNRQIETWIRRDVLRLDDAIFLNDSQLANSPAAGLVAEPEFDGKPVAVGRAYQKVLRITLVASAGIGGVTGELARGLFEGKSVKEVGEAVGKSRFWMSRRHMARLARVIREHLELLDEDARQFREKRNKPKADTSSGR